MQVLDKGEVNLINFMGGDLAVVAAARVSNGVSYEEASKGPEKDQKLISYLAKNRHGTPFEHSTFQFYVKAPLFVVREWQRHRMASYNEISGRYVEFEPEFYIPAQFRIAGKTNKQGSSYPTDEDLWALKDQPKMWVDDPTKWNVDFWNYWATGRVILATEAAYNHYKMLLDNGVAKEMARIVLPLNLYSQFYFTINARSLMNFLSLRAAEDAQWEIRQYAIAMKEMFKEKMPLTYEAWEQNGFLAP